MTDALAPDLSFALVPSTIGRSAEEADASQMALDTLLGRRAPDPADPAEHAGDVFLRPSRSAQGRVVAAAADAPWWLGPRAPMPVTPFTAATLVATLAPTRAATPIPTPTPTPSTEATLRRIGLWPPEDTASPELAAPVDTAASAAIDQPAATAATPATAEGDVPPFLLPPVPPHLPAPAPKPAAIVQPRAERPVAARGNAAAIAARHVVDGIARTTAAAADVLRPAIQHAAARTVDFVLDIVHPTQPAAFVGGRDLAGASAQAEFEWRRALHRRKMRAALPAVVGITLIGMAMGFALFIGRGFLLAGFGSVAVGALGVWAITRLPAEALAWGRAAADQRRTAEYLEELRAAGYVVLHDRLAPGLRTNVDHVAIGPAGVFVIETKNLRGKLTIAGEKLFVGERTRTGVIDEAYRESLAVQLALSDRLNELRSTVRPVLCVHRTLQLLLDNEVQGVRVISGPQLMRYVRRLPVVLDAAAVQDLAALADSRLQPAVP